MKTRARATFSILCAAAVFVAACSRSGTREASEISPVLCADLASTDHRLDRTSLISAEVVATGEFTPPGTAARASQPVEDLPAFCRVTGLIEPAIRFEVWLPEQAWNGKFQGVGNGGMAGTVSYRGLMAALRRGYAAASTDTGHASSGVPFDASWSSNEPGLTADFGHRGLHLTTVAGKRLTELRYGRAPEHSYYLGCSKGGQQGLMEAQRYPEDYDGIVAGDPAHDWTSFYAGAHLWYSLATLKDEASYIPPEQVQVLGDAVNAACDQIDGIQDGVLDDPRRCGFDPEELLCVPGSSGQDCFSAKQVQAVKDIWGGARNSAGELIFPGLVPGGEAGPGGWARWVTGPEPFRSLHWLAGEGFFRHMVFADPDWDFRSFDYDTDLPSALETVGDLVDANDPDLRPLRDRGAKLLVYHGWSDPDISPLTSIDYFERVVESTSSADSAHQALAETQEFFRLFMVPGMGHCAGGPGTSSFDALAAMESWVEEGAAPSRIEAVRRVNGEVVRSRPLCPYPRVARWNGTGSTDDAANFDCVEVDG